MDYFQAVQHLYVMVLDVVSEFIVKPENKRTLWKTQNTSPLLARFGTSPFYNV